MKQKLTLEQMQLEAFNFAKVETSYDEPCLYGVTDGKAVGTYLEQKFTSFLSEKYSVKIGNSASGIDLPLKLISK